MCCTDSRSALAALREGPAAQRSKQGAEVWRRLLAVSAEGRPVYLQWVPSHYGIPGNDVTEELAREAAAMAQSEAPFDTTAVYRAATRQARERTARDRPGYSGGARPAMGWYRELMEASSPPPPPPISDMDRSSAVDVHQMRTGR